MVPRRDTLRPVVSLSERPGLARCIRSSAATIQSKLDAKLDTSERIKALWPKLSWRKRADKLCVDESTLRGQLHPDALNRGPSDKVLRMLEHYEGIASLSARKGAAG
ncbi:MAG TPA: hypothetical protein VJN18_32425 [Polyangiaceae bacterium]|nr:hypothetical protein [Polyangiaceae bacterium]